MRRVMGSGVRRNAGEKTVTLSPITIARGTVLTVRWLGASTCQGNRGVPGNRRWVCVEGYEIGMPSRSGLTKPFLQRLPS